MANKILRTPMDDTPVQISFANFAGDFNPTATNDLRQGTDTETELALLNLADAAAAQSAQVDLGAKWAEQYLCTACVEMQVAAATSGSTVDIYWNATNSSTAANANMGDASGSAAAYAPYAGDAADLASGLAQLIFIGSLVMSDEAVDSIQVGAVGILSPSHRYGSLIVVNNTGQVVCDTDDIEAHLVLSPIIPEIQ